MSKRGYISRYMLIIKKLKSKPYSTYEELMSFIDNRLAYLQMQDENLTLGFSKRTLQRDLKEIRNLFGIDIEYSTTNKGYFINQSQYENKSFDRMIEAFDLFNSLNLAQDLAPFIHVEKKAPQGTENLYGLIHAIKNKLRIKYVYQKFWEEDSTQRVAEPYALKEFKSRWYVLAKDAKDHNIKSFALDRLTDLEITKHSFLLPVNFNVEAYYEYCFGIIHPNDEQPQNIILSFDPIQGKYIKTLPLHHSQQILIDNETEIRVHLKICIAHDFIMELLSLGENVKVIAPKELAEEIKMAHERAWGLY